MCRPGRPVDDWHLKGFGCDAGDTATRTVKIFSHNLYWWNLYDRRGGNGRSAAKLLVQNSGPEEYDLLGLQECGDVSRYLNDAKREGLSEDYGSIEGGHGLAIAYRPSRWTPISSGMEIVGEDGPSQYFGTRGAQWARLRRDDGQTVLFLNHHGPLPFDSGGRCGGTATGYNIMRTIALHAHAGDAVFLVGDFNARRSASSFSVFEKHMYVTKSSGGWGIDHILSTCSGERVVYSAELGKGGSDHPAMHALFRL
jgi:hypothetical protein